MVILFRNNLLRPSSSCERNAVPVRITLHEDHKFLCKRKSSMLVAENWSNKYRAYGVDKNIQVDVTFCILYFSSNNCWICFGQPCTHYEELRTAWCYCFVFVCALASGRLTRPFGKYCVHGWVHFTTEWWNEPIHGRTTCQPDLTTSLHLRHIQTRGYIITRSSAPDDGHTVARNTLSNY